MPNIQVTCPECKSVLEIGAEFAGQEIECGNCLHVFVAETRPTRPDSAGRSGSGVRRRTEDAPDDRERSRSARSSQRRDEEDDSDRRSARRRRDEEEDDDFDYSPPRPRSSGPGAASVAALVLGLLSSLALPATCCGCCSILTWPVTIPLGLAAIITGAFGLNDPKGKPLAITGMVIGTVSLAFVALQLVIGFGPLVVPPGPPR